MNQTLKNQIEKTLALALLNFKDEEETLKFLKIFLSEKELETLSKRLSVAYWLSKSRTPKNIKDNLKANSKEINETKKMLEDPAIKSIIKKIDADIWATKWSSRLRELLKN